MKLALLLPTAVLLPLAACSSGGQNPQENAADRLEQAAEQSDPAAAPVLENAAEAVREGEMSPQDAMQQAGNAQAGTVDVPAAAPPSVQAQPNRTGQQTPPPKVPTGPGAAAGTGNSQ